MKATEQHIPEVLFTMLYKVVLTFESVDEILKCDHSNESYREHYFPVELFIMLYKVILILVSVYEIRKCDYSDKSCWALPPCGTFKSGDKILEHVDRNESYLAVRTRGAVYYAVQGASNFWVRGYNP